jgi:hypothetical protein
MSAILVAATDQVSCDLDGESVILHLSSGMYYGLNAIGARIWGLIQAPRSVMEIRDTLLAEYDVDPARCESDLLILLEQLVAERLVEVQDETNR